MIEEEDDVMGDKDADGLPIWYRYDDGVGHLTAYESDSFTHTPGQRSIETALCGKRNIMTLDISDKNELHCAGCLAVLTMKELAE